MRCLLFLLGAAMALQAQDWDAIDRQLAAVQKAVHARDLKAAQDASNSLSRLTTGEWLKSNTPADTLREMEARVAANPVVRTDAAGFMALLAAQSGEGDKAHRYALDAFAAPSSVTDSAHVANNVLGLVALHQSDVPAAETYLRAAGKSKGSATLKRWGPTLALAKELLDKGRNDVVLEYFESCKSFVTENKKLDVWIATLKGGAAPDLSHEHLWYQ